MAVVGAGLSGLVAARELAAAGREVAVVEARDRVGGRIVNEPIGDGVVVEMGGQWIGPTQERIAALASDLGIETFPTHTDGDNVLELDGRLRRYSGLIPRIGPLALADLARARRRLTKLARDVPAAAPWEARRAAELDATSLGDWLRRTARTGAARMLFSRAVQTAWGHEPEEMSLLYALGYMSSAGGFDAMLDVEGGAQQDRLVGGSQLVATKLAEGLGDRVVLGAPVRRIVHGDWGVRISADGADIVAARAIVAVPPNLAGRIDYEPPLPAGRDGLTQRTPNGAMTKCVAVYDEPFWRADGLSGEGVSGPGPIAVTFDNSPPEGRPGALVAFLGGRDARDVARWSPEDRRAAVLECLGRLFGPRATRPERYVEQDWAAEEWSRGGAVCAFGTGGLTGFGRWLREPVGPIHWAGSETATVWCGYMDGAVSSGERAAREVLEAQAAVGAPGSAPPASPPSSG